MSVIEGFVYKAPSHEYHMDFHLLSRFDLPVVEATVIESDRTQEFIRTLEDFAGQGLICRPVNERYSLPFIQAFAAPAIGGSHATTNP